MFSLGSLGCLGRPSLSGRFSLGCCDPVSYTHLDVYKRQKQFRSLLNGVLVQERDLDVETPADLKQVTEKAPTATEIEDMLFACLLYTSPFLFLFLAGVIMVYALITSKKAQNVVKTSVDLSRQDEGCLLYTSYINQAYQGCAPLSSPS